MFFVIYLTNLNECGEKVSTEEGKTLATQLGCPFYETSAALRHYIDDAFYTLIREIRRKEEKRVCFKTNKVLHLSQMALYIYIYKGSKQRQQLGENQFGTPEPMVATSIDFRFGFPTTTTQQLNASLYTPYSQTRHRSQATNKNHKFAKEVKNTIFYTIVIPTDFTTTNAHSKRNPTIYLNRIHTKPLRTRAIIINIAIVIAYCNQIQRSNFQSVS